MWHLCVCVCVSETLMLEPDLLAPRGPETVYVTSDLFQQVRQLQQRWCFLEDVCQRHFLFAASVSHSNTTVTQQPR